MRYLSIDIRSIYTRALSVTAFLHGKTIGIYANVLKNKDIAQIGIETFNKNIRLPMAETCSPVNGAAEAVGTFLLEVFGKPYLHALTAYCRNMQILVIRLRSAEACRVGQTCLKILARFEEQIDTRTEYRVIDKIVLIDTRTYKQCKKTHFPLVLDKRTGNADILLHIAFIASHHVMQLVLLILQTAGKRSRREKELLDAACICRTADPS